MSVTTAQAVTLLENVLFESPTIAQANAASWVSQSATNNSLSSVAGLAAAMAATPEGEIAQQVVRYYMGALGRAPRGDEIQYYINVVEAGLTADQLAQGAGAVPGTEWNQIAAYFAASPEFQGDFGLTAGGQVTTINEIAVITAFYTNILGRLPNAAEINYYETLLNTGTALSTLVQYFTTSPEYQTNVDANIAQALAGNGTAVVAGTTLTSIPYTPIAVTLGSSAVTVTGLLNTTAVSVTGSPAAAAQTAQTAVAGVIGVLPVTAATGVQGVTAITAVNPVAGRSAVTAVTDGAVTINDISSGTTGAGVIKSVTLANSGAGSVINDNGLTALTLIGTTGTLALTNLNTAAISAHASILALTVNGLSATANTITDTNNEIATLTITTATADSVLAGFTDTHLTALTVTGTNALELLAINSTLTSLTLSGSASFSDGATTHGGGLAALGSQVKISDTSSGSFTAALDDTTQSFTGGSGLSVITVSALTDATKTINGGTKAGNELIFEGGPYLLTSASSGKFVNFQTVGVAANVGGTIDLSIVDPAAKAIEVIGANSGIAFTKVTSGASLLLDPSAGASVSLSYADATGAKDSTTVTMSSSVTALTLQDSANVGVGTLTIVNNLSTTDTVVSPAHVIGTPTNSGLTDNGLSTLNVTGTAGLVITTLNEVNTPAATAFTLNNGSTSGYGVTISSFTDAALATLTFAGAGTSTIGTLNTSVTTLAVANSGAVLGYIGTIADSSLTSFTLGAGVALGQAATALTTNGLQDGSTAGVTVTGGSDNAHVTVNLINGAGAGKSDSITLGNGNNVVLDASTAGSVAIKLGSGANLVELGSGSLDTTAKYSVTFAARTAAPPNVVFIGADGTSYASAPNLVITGATNGDIIAFGNDSASSGATLTATSLSSATSLAGALATLEGITSTRHKVAYGVYGGNTYIVESSSGTVGVTDTVVVEVTGSQTLTASTGFVTLGNSASTLTAGSSLLGAGFTIPAGTATNLTLGAGGNIVNMTGPSSGVTDTFTSIAASSALSINYQATSGTDTIQMAGTAGNNASDIGALTVNDTSTVNAGVTIGAFTDNQTVDSNGNPVGGLTRVTYNNTSISSSLMTQQTLTSNSLNTINFTGGISVTADNYLFSGVLTTQGTLTFNDSNAGLGTATMGLVLTGGASTLTLNMTSPGTLVTGTLPDNNLTTLNINGTQGVVAVGTVIDSTTQGFTVNDTLSSNHPATIVLSGLSAASSITVNDSAGQNLTDNSTYSDTNLTALNLTNTGTGILTIGFGGLSISSPTGAASASQINIGGSSTGSIVTGTITDTGSGALTITDTYAATGTSTVPSTVTLPLDSSGTGFTVTSLTINDTSSAALILGSLVDNALTSLSLTNTGNAAMTFAGGMTVNALSTFNLTLGGTGAINIGTITDTLAGPIGVNVNSTSSALTTLTFNSAGFAATSFSVDANTKGGLTIAALTDNSATDLAFSNNGSGLLTITGITDNTATLHVTIPDTANLISSSSGPMTINLIGGGATELDISDSGTGTVALNLSTVNAVQAIKIANGGPGGNNITLTDTVAASTAITLTGSGNQSITLSDNGGTIILNGTVLTGAGANAATGSYSIILPAALHVIELPTATLASNANTTVVTADHFSNFHLDTALAIGDTLSFGGFTSPANVLTAADVNPGSAIVWTVTNGMMTSTNATVLNFIAAVQAATTAVTVAGTSGIAGFYDGHGNTWIAYNDHSGSNVAVIELVGVSTVAGIESTGAQTNFVHIA